jgi:hypothetical protein
MKYKNRLAQIGLALFLCAMWYCFISLVINIWNTSLLTAGGVLSIFFIMGLFGGLIVASIILFYIIIVVGDWK